MIQLLHNNNNILLAAIGVSPGGLLLYPGLNPSRELIMSVVLWWARGSYTGQGGVRLIAGFNVNVMFKEEMRLFRNSN
jgi:hypothetical protein